MNTDLLQLHSHVFDGNLSFKSGSQHEVVNNRNKFFTKHGLSASSFVAMRATHQTKIAEVDLSQAGAGILDFKSGFPVDALVTQANKTKLGLFLLTGDCLPVVIFDTTKELLCLAHLSRLNTQLNFMKIIGHQLIHQHQSHPSNWQIYFGPCIKKESYLVDEQPYDLVGLNQQALFSLGVNNTQINIDPTDTFTSKEYFSHQRSVQQHEPEGRFATIVQLCN